LRTTDLHPSLLRTPVSANPFYVPPPVVPKPRARRRGLGRTLLAVGLVTLASAAFSERIGEQSALAAIVRDAPTWAAAIDLAVAEPEAAPAAERAEKADMVVTPSAPIPAAPARVAPKPGDGRTRVALLPVAPDPGLAGTAVSAFAPAEVAVDAPFALLLGEESGRDAGEAPARSESAGREHWWSDRPLPEDVTDQASLRCLAEAVYHEARSESETGQRAVAQVVINRVKNPAYPDDVCGVVYQNRSRHNRCQFTFACDGVKDVITEQSRWAMAKRIAREYAAEEYWLGEIGAATHYHNHTVTPTWAALMTKAQTIGHHVFYITKGGGWT